MKVFAHRGASGRSPEMTLSAYISAIEDKADGFECDVRLTLDQEIACFHDADTERIAGVKRRVSKMKLSEIRDLAATITLDELITLAIANKKDLLIESKHPVATGGLVEKRVLDLLKQRSAEISQSGIEIVCMSFSWFAVRRFAKSNQSCTVVKFYLQALLARTSTIALNIDLVRNHAKLVTKLQRRGKRLFVWTVNEESDLEFCKKLGIDGVITNYPDRARKYV
jgi:glycerophosphoryl diester phosphodiesterase